MVGLKKNVNLLVAKFNTQVMDNDGYSLNPASTDIVGYMFIYVDKTSKYGDDAIKYAKHLIKANYNEITETEINILLKEAKTKSTTGKTAYNGKGISVDYLDNNDYYQYQVLRFYK